jgi:hypothetical protein
LLIKAQLMPIGADKHWERIDTRKREGIIAGDTTMRGILVTLYLPEGREFADILIRPKDAANMADVYSAVAKLDVTKVETSNEMSQDSTGISPANRRQPATDVAPQTQQDDAAHRFPFFKNIDAGA